MQTNATIRSLMLTVPFACAVFAASAPGHADDEVRWPHRYASNSISLLGGGGLTVGEPYGSADPQGLTTLSLVAIPRFVLHHFTLQPTVGVAFSNPGNSGSTLFTFAVGVAGGYAFAIHERLALTPLLGFDFGYLNVHTNLPVFGAATSEFTHGRLYVELPLEIFVGRNGFIEPYVDLGADFPFTNGGKTVFAFGIGYRIGVVF